MIIHLSHLERQPGIVVQTNNSEVIKSMLPEISVEPASTRLYTRTIFSYIFVVLLNMFLGNDERFHEEA